MPLKISSDPNRIADSQKLVLPGVGAFRDAIARLLDSGLAAPLSNTFTPASLSSAFASACNCSLARAMKTANTADSIFFRARSFALPTRPT